MTGLSCRILILSLIAFGLAGCYSPPAENALAGKTETAVKAQLGQPAHEFAGHYGLPPITFAQRFTGPIKTLVFTRSGWDLYVSFEKRNGSWIAICNSSVQHGAVF